MAPGSRTFTGSRLGIRRMPVIAEDEDSPPSAVPEGSAPDAIQNALPRYSYAGHPPPDYSTVTSPWGSLVNAIPPSEPAEKDKRPNWFSRRGGWYRAASLVLLGVGGTIALAVGLTVGLRASSPPSAVDSLPPLRFPAGSYSFTTALTSISTSCTSDPATFRCYPYIIYNASQNTSSSETTSSSSSSSRTSFWTIHEPRPSSFLISAAPNPFVPQFTNVSMRLLDANQPTERFTFNFTMQLTVTPASQITRTAMADTTTAEQGNGDSDDNSRFTCYYHDTVASATIWIRRPAEFPRNLDTPVSNGGNGTHVSTSFDPWPYAVDLAQVSEPGPAQPECRDADGGRAGDFAAPSDAEPCGCWYRNYGLGS